MLIPHGAHVLVLDGAKLLLLRNSGTDTAPNLAVAKHDQHDSAATHDQGSDEPGTAQASTGSVRSGYEQTDHHQQDEDRFAVAAAEMLKTEVLAHRIMQLIVVAAPKTLGVLRKHYHGEVEKRLLGEIAKDVAGRPNDEITALILAH